MSTTAQKANLARIRDNQRRSRARRREYLQELEQRLRAYELQGVEASSEVQQAARRVAEENRQLRGLLNRHGIGDDYISSYLHSNSAIQPDSNSYAQSNSGGAVQSLQHIIAPRRPLHLDPSASYALPPQESREASIASVSTSSSSPWESSQSMHSGHLYGRQLPSQNAAMARLSVPSQMQQQHYAPQGFPGNLVPRTETYSPIVASHGALLDPRRHSYSGVPMTGDSTPTMGYTMSIAPYHNPVGPDTDHQGPC